jgi:hypothetical protein
MKCDWATGLLLPSIGHNANFNWLGGCLKSLIAGQRRFIFALSNSKIIIS